MKTQLLTCTVTLMMAAGGLNAQAPEDRALVRDLKIAMTEAWIKAINDKKPHDPQKAEFWDKLISIGKENLMNHEESDFSSPMSISMVNEYHVRNAIKDDPNYDLDASNAIAMAMWDVYFAAVDVAKLRVPDRVLEIPDNSEYSFDDDSE